MEARLKEWINKCAKGKAENTKQTPINRLSASSRSSLPNQVRRGRRRLAAAHSGFVARQEMVLSPKSRMLAGSLVNDTLLVCIIRISRMPAGYFKPHARQSRWSHLWLVRAVPIRADSRAFWWPACTRYLPPCRCYFELEACAGPLNFPKRQ